MKKAATTLALVAMLALAACSDQGQSSSQAKEKQVATQQQDQFLQSQPVPIFTQSQLRQNLIELETAQANATATTSFMFLLAGVGESGPMVHSCPSIGFPIPATYQLTNPAQVVGNRETGLTTIGQLEPTGIYTGDTTGTYVMCVDSTGKVYAFYHEGYVSTVTGPAHWDVSKGEVVLDGPSSAEFSTTP